MGVLILCEFRVKLRQSAQKPTHSVSVSITDNADVVTIYVNENIDGKFELVGHFDLPI